jgi:hypothetical protein
MQPPIIVGLLTASTPAAVAFWQWFNQSYNAAVFYSNKSCSSPMPDSQIAMSYVAAVGAAIGVGLGARTLGTRMARSGSGVGLAVKMFAPFMGVVTAGCTNLLCMRNDELWRGVPIRDPAGNEVGLSRRAGGEGLAMCCAARLFWNIPILGVTPLLTGAFYRTAFFASNPWSRIPCETVCGTAMLLVGIYPAQAVFAQQATIPASRLEPEFQGLPDPTRPGCTIESFTYDLRVIWQVWRSGLWPID